MDVKAAPSDDPFAAALRGFGPLGIVAILAIGLVFGTIFAVTGRIVVLMCAHAVRLTALALIYWNLESDVAHL